jgi:16S rRNA (cytidine1402-2'-O)-methyltransferase
VGTLFLVGTPIGNLEDITLRAVAVLRQVNRIAAEDTRRTRALLAHLEIRGTPLHSLDAHADDRSISVLVDHLVAGEQVALVTDAGMPGVSDPGAQMVRAATTAGVPVVVVPGPSAVTTAVTLSGLVEAPFVFLGFLPRRGQRRQAALGRIATTADPVVLFEAPGRTAETLRDLAALMPERAAVVCREMTKLHEEAARGSLEQLARREDWRGEIVVVLGAAPDAEAARAPAPEEQVAAIQGLLSEGRHVRDVAAELAAHWGLPRRDVYALAQRIKSQNR